MGTRYLPRNTGLAFSHHSQAVAAAFHWRTKPFGFVFQNWLEMWLLKGIDCPHYPRCHLLYHQRS